MDKKIALVKAIGKVIWVQNDLFAKWYVRDGDEYAGEMEQPEFEKEGYLNGKKVLVDIEEAAVSSPAAGVCPFTGNGGGDVSVCQGCTNKDDDSQTIVTGATPTQK